MEELIAMIAQFISGVAVKYPVILTVFSVMGVARMIFKPLRDVVEKFVMATPSEKDNDIWAKYLKIEQGPIGKAVSYVFDLLLSIKIPKK